ncbi:MAG: hypothetical protein V7604_1413 [Hyphomicrobiales bacterium]|jgi:hypothetical protein
MTTIASLFAAGLLIWFALLTVLIVMRVLNGDIFAAGMLLQNESDSGVAPERVLAMASFPAVIIGYAMVALHADVSTAHPSLPDVPETLINLLTGGNAVYLAGKIARGN